MDAGLEPGEVLVGDKLPYPRSPFVAQARRDAAAERARGVTHGPPAYKAGSRRADASSFSNRSGLGMRAYAYRAWTAGSRGADGLLPQTK